MAFDSFAPHSQNDGYSAFDGGNIDGPAVSPGDTMQGIDTTTTYIRHQLEMNPSLEKDKLITLLIGQGFSKQFASDKVSQYLQES